MPRAGDSNQRRSRISNPGTRAPHEPPSAPPQANQPKQRRLTWTLHAATLVGEEVADAAVPTDSGRRQAPPRALAHLRISSPICRAWRWRPATAGSALRAFGDGPIPQICLEMSGLMGLRLVLLWTYLELWAGRSQFLSSSTMVVV